MEILLVIAGIALIGAIAYFSYLQEKKRREEMGQLADSLGWSFSPEKHGPRSLERFDMFDKGHSRAAYNTMRGEFEANGLPCTAQAGDYRYKVTSGSGKNRRTTTYNLSYLAFRLPFPATPDLLIRREGLMDKISGAIGFDDIDFESEEFSRKFFVKSRDRRFAYDLIHPRMMEKLLDCNPPRIDLIDGYVCLSNGTRRWSPSEFNSELRFARQFLELWPEHLAADLRS